MIVNSCAVAEHALESTRTLLWRGHCW